MKNQTAGIVVGATIACSVAVFGAVAAAATGSGIIVPQAAPSPFAAQQAEAVVLVAQAGAAPVDRPVSFTSAQAERGKKVFVEECVDCHGDDLRGGVNGGPPLRGLAFEQKYANGAPASAMFLFMSTLMPPNDPGRYSAETYADMMAYILQENRFQPGNTELPSDIEALDHLIVEQ